MVDYLHLIRVLLLHLWYGVACWVLDGATWVLHKLIDIIKKKK